MSEDERKKSAGAQIQKLKIHAWGRRRVSCRGNGGGTHASTHVPPCAKSKHLNSHLMSQPVGQARLITPRRLPINSLSTIPTSNNNLEAGVMIARPTTPPR